ncbi:LexA repressor [Oceanicaulis alexandrii HTCC2633]|uniref:LexA family protein n=1 Tax=Oceanicaulis sp. HTCC2633 TaxID=314254 RepID=UPI0000668C7D|nr:MarR family transcriptional regulator [Oceanicaulis sp. HTCC2633]EAP88634.1 LexA repressor [Oceanicaulis alexandrii HTCC2633] [Oceanicaulis sp. HTCC2633]
MSDTPFALTPRQRQVLDALIAAIDSTGVTPSFQEIADEIGLGSKSGVARIMDALEQRGWIQRLPNFARAIRILRRPEELEAQWLIWSVIYGSWWRPDRAGYTRVLAEAGRYTRHTALSISGRARDGWDGTAAPTEVPVRLEDAMAAAAMGAEITSAIRAHAVDPRGRA